MKLSAPSSAHGGAGDGGGGDGWGAQTALSIVVQGVTVYSAQGVHVDVQPPRLAPLADLYLPAAHATHEPSLEHVLVAVVELGAGQEHPERYSPGPQLLVSHGAWECGLWV